VETPGIPENSCKEGIKRLYAGYKMRILIVTVLIGLFCFSCSNQKAQQPASQDVEIVTDTIGPEDEMWPEEEREEVGEEAADGHFFDFIYAFATDSMFQRSRIVFPLPYYHLDQALRIEAADWEVDPLFFDQLYYTLLFDHEEEMELAEDEEEQTSVQVEWWLLESRQVKRYYFERKEGIWILEAINVRPVEEDTRENFGDFFVRFATDSVFQSQRIRQPLTFVTADPDDDFSILETTLDPDQWFAFRPPLPTQRLSNINYGQHNEDRSATKIVALKGIGNGFSNILYFKRRRGEWELYKFEDASM